jgi:hypothetical protein
MATAGDSDVQILGTVITITPEQLQPTGLDIPTNSGNDQFGAHPFFLSGLYCNPKPNLNTLFWV